MSNTTFDFEPTIILLNGLLKEGQNIFSQNIFDKSVRMYVLLRVIYGDGITCGKINIKLSDNFKQVHIKNWFQWSDWRDQIEVNEINTGNIPDNKLGVLGTISTRNILFNDNFDAEKEWEHIFRQKYPNQNIKLIDKLIGTEKLPVFPFERGEKVFRNTLSELIKGEKCWLEPHPSYGNEDEKFTGQYHTLLELPNIDDGVNKDGNSVVEDAYTQPPEYFRDENLQDIVSKFLIDSDNKKVLFESEYVIKNTPEYRNVINNLILSMSEEKTHKPTNIIYQKFSDSNIISKVIYPVSLLYTQRAFYLYCLHEQDNKCSWDAYRLDRIKELEIIDWDDTRVPTSLLENYQNDSISSSEDIRDYLETDKALGYAFWKSKKWTIVRFDRSHYEKYINETSRKEVWFELDLRGSESLIELIQQKAKKINRINTEFPINDINNEHKQLQSIKKIVLNTSNEEKYVFCLAKYYEGDSYVFQRLLAWGRQVKVLFPQELKNKVSKEIQATWEQYQD